ncbi:hypothetical protein C0989_010061 [Termitomyces sp. Mn162]|nr:hypothetical protein C0989_010061 [Termitomyces sp. Mn162]
MNKYNKIQTPLIQASQNLMDAMNEIRQFSEYLTDDEFEGTLDKCENTMQSVVGNLRKDAAHKSFLVKLEEYRVNKELARKSLISSIDVQAEVKTVSTRAKRRAEQEKKKTDQATNNERLKRVDIIQSLGVTETTSAPPIPTHTFMQAAACHPSPSRSQPDKSPFQDPPASNLNLAGEAGDISLQCISN